MSENKCEYTKINDYKSAFECFKQRFLIERKSIFRLEDKENILTEESINYLMENFVNNGYGGKVSFIEKIKYQLITNPKNKSNMSDVDLKNLQKKAIEVLAHIVWLWRLVPVNAKMSSTKTSIEEVLHLCKENELKIDKNNPFFSDKIKGIASVGTYYNTNKPFEIAYVIKLINELLNKKAQQDDSIDASAIKILNEFKGKAKISGENDLVFDDNKKQYEEEKTAKHETEKSASIHHALTHFFQPDNYEAIVSNGHKKSILQAFEDLIEKNNESDDTKIKCIKEKLNEKFPNLEQNIHFFYQDEIRELWDPTILPAKNVIYYGAPGTGKTYEITNLVRKKTKNDKKYYQVVQFHPSFSYEDFIDGIKPIASSNNGVQLNLINGIFKEMCIEAFKELENNKNNPENAKKFYFIADEINRAELSRVFGELLLCLEDDKRLRFEKNDTEHIELKGELVKTQNSNLWEKQHAVVIENDEYYFGVPENIYFLGTMNDIDRSIDSFDLALRRRFKWIRKDCNYDVIADYLIENDADDYINEYVGGDGSSKGRCLLLNEYISDNLNLGKSYELGHTYFMKIKIRNGKISKIAYENLFDFEIGPLITEYLRAEYPDGKELEKKVKEMRNLFITGSIKNNDTNS
ncbi:MAG: McrB family protein [Arcobacteraceae bacterium]